MGRNPHKAKTSGTSTQVVRGSFGLSTPIYAIDQISPYLSCRLERTSPTGRISLLHPTVERPQDVWRSSFHMQTRRNYRMDQPEPPLLFARKLEYLQLYLVVDGESDEITHATPAPIRFSGDLGDLRAYIRSVLTRTIERVAFEENAKG